MAHSAIRDYLRAVGGSPSGVADSDLLDRFAATRDEAAFELLVWRHAALVQKVCRAVLRDHHAAEDASQATFLALARKAHTFSGRGSVVGWLYRVARRVSVKLARERARRPTTAIELDCVLPAQPESGLAPDEAAFVCAEIDRLPERYRIVVLLCFFEGLTQAEAAQRTAVPIGTIAGRLARAKDLLARRLRRSGVGLPAIILAVPAGSFVTGTAQGAATFARGSSVVPGIQSSVVQLAEGALKTMTVSIWKSTAAAVALMCVVSAGVLGLAPMPANLVPVAGTEPPKAAPAPPAAALAAEPPDGKRIADAKQRALSLNHLKQIVLAMHNYESVNEVFPGDLTDKDGRPLLSWRVAILPYLDQVELFKKFKLDEPWDSKDNKKLLSKMPDVFRVGFEAKDATKTYYQGFAGPGTLFEPGKRVKITDITDGTSNTIAVAEAGPPVAWTQPSDIPYGPKRPLAGMGGPFTNVLMAATADGAAHTFRRTIDETNLRRLIERDDGEVVNYEGLGAKFVLTKEELKSAEELLTKTEKMMLAFAEQYREQQKLLVELSKKRNPDDPIEGIDIDHLSKMQTQLETMLGELKRETELLRTQLEEKK
jgi:RNA polymerase sigma factor (sigma-70 family)